MKKGIAIFGAGCFWGVQYYFDQVPGVLETTAGYIGGHLDHPSYEDVITHTTGHAEAVKIVYDPQAVLAGASKASLVQGAGEQHSEAYDRYGKRAAKSATPQQTDSRNGVDGSAGQQIAAFGVLLKQFFRMHDPTQLNRQGPDIGDNYRSAVFYLDDRQKKAAQKTIDELNKSDFDGKIMTSLEKAGSFWPAEDYHQKFTERTGRGMCHVDYAPV